MLMILALALILGGIFGPVLYRRRHPSPALEKRQAAALRVAALEHETLSPEYLTSAGDLHHPRDCRYCYPSRPSVLRYGGDCNVKNWEGVEEFLEEDFI